MDKNIKKMSIKNNIFLKINIILLILLSMKRISHKKMSYEEQKTPAGGREKIIENIE